MSPVLIIRHVPHEGPGYLGEFFARKNIPTRLLKIDEGEPVPETIDGFSGLVLMGGPMSVNDPLAWMEHEITLTRQAIDERVPVVGHCLGGQVIARSLGAEVVANTVTEIGWHKTSRVDNNASNKWLPGLGHMDLFHWHSETFNLPAGSLPILTGDFCKNQGFVYDNTLALQCHIEMTEEMVLAWCEINRSTLSVSDSVQSIEAMCSNLPEKIANLNRIAQQIYSVWIKELANK